MADTFVRVSDIEKRLMEDDSSSSSDSSSDNEDSGSESEAFDPITIKICGACYRKIDKNAVRAVNMELQLLPMMPAKEEHCKICRSKVDKNHPDKLTRKQRVHFVKSTMNKKPEASIPLLNLDEKRRSNEKDSTTSANNNNAANRGAGNLQELCFGSDENHTLPSSSTGRPVEEETSRLLSTFRYLVANQEATKYPNNIPSEIANLTGFYNMSIAVLKDVSEMKALLKHQIKKQHQQARKSQMNARKGCAQIAKSHSVLETAIHEISEKTARNETKISHLQSSIAELKTLLQTNEGMMNFNNQEVLAKIQRVTDEVSNRPNQNCVQGSCPAAPQPPYRLHQPAGMMGAPRNNLGGGPMGPPYQ